MSKFSLFLLLLSCAIALAADECDVNIDQFSSKIELTNSTQYKVIYHKTYVEVNVFVKGEYGGPDAWYEHTLVKRGCPTPPEAKGAIIQIPVNTITILETTSAAFLNALGVLNKIKATGMQSFITYKPVKSYIEQMKKAGQEVVNVDYFQDNGWSATNISKVVEVNSDVAIGSHWTLLANRTDVRLFLEESSYEENQFGVAEVVKVLGLLTGREDAANNFYDRIYDDYIEAKKEIEAALEEHIDSNKEKVKVLVGGKMASTQVQGEFYWATAGGYTRKIIEDAGANILNDISVDAALESGKTADVWINVGTGYYTRTETLLATDSSYGKILPLQKGNVWDRTLKVDQDPNHDYTANEFFQTGQIYPNLVLKDLAKIFYPEVMIAHQFQYYMNIPAADTSSGIDWNNPSTYPVNCAVGEWSDWSDCSEKCDEGIQKRTRPIIAASKNGGEACPSLEETKACYNKCKDTTLIIILVVVFVVVIVVAAIIVWFCVARHTKNKIRSQLIGKTPEEQKEIINHLVEI